MRLKWIPWILGIVLLTVSVPRPARAQDDPAYRLATEPYAAYNGGKLDKVDLFSGNLSIHIPLISYPQPGGKLRLAFALDYHSGPALVTESCDSLGNCTTYGPRFNHGWQVVQEGTGSLTWVTNAITGGTSASDFDAYAYQSANGVHELAPTSTANFGSSTEWRAIDGSGYLVECTAYCASYTVISPNGVQSTYQGNVYPATVTDPNGNTISYAAGSGWTESLHPNADPFIPVQQSDSPSTADPNVCPSVSGQPAATTSYLWSLPGVNGGTYPVKFCYFTYDESYEYFDMNGYEYGGGYAQELQSVVLPDGEAWVFQYNTSNGSADLTSITFPTGGTISYGWTSMSNGPDICNAYECVGDIVSSRTTNPQNGGVSGTWGYAYAHSGTQPNITYTTTVTDAASNNEVYTFSSLDYESPYETEAQYYQGSGTLLKTVSTTYSYSTPFDGNSYWPLYTYAVNVVPTQVTTTWAATGQTSTVDESYDTSGSFYWPLYTNNDQYNGSTTPWTGTLGFDTAKSDYDYGNTLLRKTSTTYMFQSNSSYLNANLMSLPSSVQITNGSGTQVALTDYGYDASGCSSGACGSLTSVSRWLNTTGGYVTTTNTYDSSGDMLTSTDPKGDQTTYGYGSGYSGSGPTSVTNALSQTTNYAYDANTGLLTSVTDANNNTTSYSYDQMLRTTQINYPDGGETLFSYGTPSGGETDIQVQQKIDNSGHWKTSTVVVDGLGRKIRTQLTSDPQGTDYVDTTYDSMGRVASVSNPYRTTSDPTYGVTGYVYDPFGRPTTVTEPDNSTITTEYSGPCATVTDEAGKTRKSCSDALGQLGTVVENPGGLNYTTTYTYDALGNLTGVDENGQTRSFVYDSLSRLTSATNPESGTTTYYYDTNPSGCWDAGTARTGDLTGRLDADGNLYCPLYDQLGRLYSAGSASGCQRFSYDAVGRLAERSTDNCGSPLVTSTDETFTHDAMGRVLSQTTTVAGVTKTTGYTYNLLGSLTTLTYPSGLVVTYTPDAAGRESSAQDVADGVSYVSGSCTNVNGGSGACYAPTGALASDVHGQVSGGFNGITETWDYNNRLEPISISAVAPGSPATTVMSLDYSYSPDGSVSGSTNYLDNGRNQTMTYDPLNRVLSAEAQAASGQDCWGVNFGDDALGNLLSMSPSKCTAPNLSVGVSGSNWIDTPSGFQYDADGDMTNDGQYTYAYNAENQMSSANGVTYTYDAVGERLEKSSGTLYWRSPAGHVLSESDANGTAMSDSIFFDGRRIAETVGQQQPDAGFEEGWGDWANVCGGSQLVTNDPSGAHYGSSYMEINGNGCFQSTYLLPVVPGEVVVFGGWAYRTSGSTGSVNWQLMALDANQNPVGYPSCSPGNVTSAAWMYEIGTYTVPQGVAYVRLYGQVYQSTDNASGKFDDGFLTLRGVPQYLFSDVIGSTRVVTDSSGTVCFDADYYPYGQENDYNTSCAPEFRFAGMEYDSETGNYYDHARYYNPRLGRFMSPDPRNAGASPGNPQSWNGYSYVLNNPETLIDPSGLACENTAGETVPCPTGTSSDHSYILAQAVSPSAPSDVAQILSQELLWATFSHAAFPLRMFLSGGLPLLPTQPQTRTCSANAHGVRNNLPTRAPNRKGAYGVPETRGTAAIDRSQWLPPGSSNWTPVRDNAYINKYRLQIEGYIPNGSGGYTQAFNGVSDNMGPASGVAFLAQRYPGRVLFELPGGRDLGNLDGMQFVIPSAMACPHP